MKLDFYCINFNFEATSSSTFCDCARSIALLSNDVSIVRELSQPLQDGCVPEKASINIRTRKFEKFKEREVANLPECPTVLRQMYTCP